MITRAAKEAIGLILLIGALLLGAGILAAPLPPATALCDTDTDCAEKFPGTNGDPEPVEELI